ncbi:MULTISPECIES: intradiol ring-cleavage dioxygenase [Streptomyces]|uniref:intradiol ring-cleavage dioxygenase n=2 Tax=Streptomyces TaxID=1883 RepID=UPI00103AABD7|nr:MULTISPECIES: intradiol ring-cleavage dioxygenase [Streptomyces]MBT3083706.1 intradiol ring-cleavage dioxygenase [Streptomyces sp. COG20]MBT3073796.1 intradiol ring-cleavage dioxygenase [Streptomyces sp. COG21]MBT3088907.1 intradiol ring-cleavage dioxygenase [Streptomyces sp. CYG21]MBT3097546.1 intradiol ring-cleavage dioxygenase [Streptomyces sp. CBG30]MBT3101654.1 intradiol ring-cleavage dioxygenase [Streptomyces sp. COG19]
MTPEGPAYEGRLLPHPQEEVVDQGLGFDLGTLHSRRKILGLLGGVGGMAALAACGSGSTSGSGTSSASPSASSSASAASSLTEIPDETNGPYPADGTNGVNVLDKDGIVRRDIRSSFGDSGTTAQGVPLTFELTVLDIVEGGAPMEGAAVYAWQCDRDGKYSLYSEGVENENYLRGVQVADSDGRVTFVSVFPACYPGRWPHVHFEVYPDLDSITDYDKRLSTSQLALPQKACDAVFATSGYESSVTNIAQLTLKTDNVFGDDGGVHQLATTTGSPKAGYTATLTVPIDTSTEPTGGNAPGGGSGGGPEGGSGGGPEGASGGGPGGQPPGEPPSA